MTHVDAMPTGYATIDLSIRPGLVGYVDSASLIADVASYLGLTDVRDAAIAASAAIDARRRELGALHVEPTAEEWDDALHYADHALAHIECRLSDETGGTWFASAHIGDYIVASSDWWDALEV